jgi:flagellar hook-length control protein FliK
MTGGRSVQAGTTDPADPSASLTPSQEAPTTTSAPQGDTALNHAAAFDPATQVIALPQQATPTQVAPSHAAEPVRAASPVAQLTPALVQIGHASDGAQRLTVRLQPPELGQVEIRIDRAHELPARVDITVEKQETLTLLLRDQPQLQRALDQAGVPAEGRSVTFHVAAADQPARSEPATAPAPGVTAGGTSSDGSHGTPRNDGQPMRQQADTSEETALESMPVGLSGWIRGGLDITA